MASAPYTAEAPPEMISTRLIIDDGMPLTSTTISALFGTARRPSMRVRVRFAPRPRSETAEIPTELTAEICTSELLPGPFRIVGEAAGLNAGSWFR